MRAGSDKIIAARSPSGYIQMVLAPELATLLVKEDMNVTVEQARSIMKESGDIGDLLNGTDEVKRVLRRTRVEVEED